MKELVFVFRFKGSICHYYAKTLIGVSVSGTCLSVNLTNGNYPYELEDCEILGYMTVKDLNRLFNN